MIPSVKLVLLGDSFVGKSSIIARYATDDFDEGRDATIGAAFLAKICSIEDREIKYEIWDTAGQERFHSLAPMYYRNALASIVVYDITKHASFERAKAWVNELKDNASSNMLITLVGNKTDLLELREVSIEDAALFASENGLLYFETSARSGTNVNQVFTEIAKNVHLEDAPTTSSININTNPSKGKCAC